MKLVSKGILFVVAFGLIGCGGGGSGNGGGSTGVPVNSQFLSLANTVFLYDLAGTQTDPSGTQTVSNGTRRIFLQNTSTAGRFRYETIDSFDLPGGATGAFDFRTFITQAGNQDVSVQSFSHGSDSTLISSSNLLIPGVFGAGLNFTRTFTYVEGSATYSFAVGPLVNVEVPYYPTGTAQAYRVTASLVFTNGYKREGTYYYSPSLGTYLSADETVTEADGRVGTFSVKLRSITPG